MASHNKTSSNGSNSNPLHEEQFNIQEIDPHSSQIVQNLKKNTQLQNLIESLNSIRYTKNGIESKEQPFQNTYQYSLGYNMKFYKNLNPQINLSIFHPLVMFPQCNQELHEFNFNINVQQKIQDMENNKKETANPIPIKNEQIKFGTLEIFYSFFSAKINRNKILKNELKQLIELGEFQDYEDCWILEFYQPNDYTKLEAFYQSLIDVQADKDQIRQIFKNFEIIMSLLQIYCRFIKERNKTILDKNIDFYQKQQDSQELTNSISTQNSFSNKTSDLQKDFKFILEQLFNNITNVQEKQQKIEDCYNSFTNIVTGHESNEITQNRIQGLITYLFKLTINIVEDIISIYLQNNFKINQNQNQQQKDILLIQLADYFKDEKNHNEPFQLLIDILTNQTIQMISTQKDQLQDQQQEQQKERLEVSAKFDQWIKQNQDNFDDFFQIFGQQTQLNEGANIIQTQLMWHQSPVTYRIKDIKNIIKFDITSKDKELIQKSQNNNQSDNDSDKESQNQANQKLVKKYQPTNMQKIMKNWYQCLESALNSEESKDIILQNYKIESAD